MLTVLAPDSLPDSAPASAEMRERPSDLQPDTDLQAALVRRLQRAAVAGRWSDPAVIARCAPADAWLSRELGLATDSTLSGFRRFAACPEDLAELAVQPQRYRHELTVTPAHLHAGLDHLLLQPPSLLDASAAEATQLIDSANQFFDADECRIRQLSAGCWVLTTAEPMTVELCGSDLVVGRNIDGYMPAGQDGRRLRSLLNELQMLWHDHPVNQARQASGQLTINTLWPEGYCFALPPNQPRWQYAFTPSAQTLGLLRAIGIKCQSYGGALPPMEQIDATGQGEALVELASGAGPLLTLLEQRPSLKATIVMTNDHHWVQVLVSPTDRLRFWRQCRLDRAV